MIQCSKCYRNPTILLTVITNNQSYPLHICLGCALQDYIGDIENGNLYDHGLKRLAEKIHSSIGR